MVLGPTDTVPDGKVIVSVERGILASVGIVDLTGDAVYFGDNFRLPFDASKGFTHGDFTKYPPVAVADDAVVFFAEYPGYGVAMVKATVDDVMLTLTFGSPTFIKGYKAAGTFLKGAVSAADDLYLAVVTRAGADGCFPPVNYSVPLPANGKPMPIGLDTATWGDGCATAAASFHTVRALVYSASDDAWTDTVLYEHAADSSAHAFQEYPQGCSFASDVTGEETTTTSAPPAPQVLNAFSGAPQARRLASAYYYQNPQGPVETTADKLNWTLSMVATDRAIVRARVVKTPAFVVYAVVGAYTQGQVQLLAKPLKATVPCGGVSRSSRR
jgi:hypothetical protein